jgi:hypothetical protein
MSRIVFAPTAACASRLAGGHVARAQLAETTSEARECAAWDNVAVVAEHMSRGQLRELRRQVCPDLPLSDAQRDGN